MSEDDGVVRDSAVPPVPDAFEVRGRVKWFDIGKGFGFIVPDSGEADVLLHANVLRAYGQGSVSDGAEIEVVAQQTPRGLQATEVLRIEAQISVTTGHLEEFADLSQEAVDALALEPARVKWFDRQRGFGFANVFGSDEDVFIHIEVLRRSGIAEVQPGEALCLRTLQGKRGRMAVLAAPWETALGRIGA